MIPKDGITPKNETFWTKTYYIRDAAGNPLTHYTQTMSTITTHLTQTFVDIYNAARLGAASLVREVSAELSNITFVGAQVYDSSVIDQRIASANYWLSQLPGEPAVHERWLGFKQYELSNHPARAGQCLGNTRVTFKDATSRTAADHQFDVVSMHDYYPFGKVLRAFTQESERYLTTQHPRDSETDWDYRGARFYDSDIGRFLGVDPLAHMRSWVSPYNFVQNNPINRVDPTGALDNPIYDKETSEFLGTDENGLEGDAIIMDKYDFEQGMSHEDAMEKGNTLDNMSMEQAMSFANNGFFGSFLNHYNSLPDRIDYSSDFILTKEIADKHWQGGTGEHLFVNSANIDLPGVTTEDFNSDGFYSKNFIWGMSNTGKVFGTLDMTLLDPKTGSVKLGYINPNVSPNGLVMDRYNFDYDGRKMRDFATWVGKPSGKGEDFDIHGYGVSTVPVK
ncbi:MAG: hypothetical protein GC193_03325 [Cryomorphaceae bacterium]|nr:hypothetical protein [Cryomorphaceae bacterium]